MRSLLAFWCCILLLSCNAKQCGTHKSTPGSDTLAATEQWQGIVHAVTCQDIEVKITLVHKQGADTGTYQMTQHCKDNNNVFEDTGLWRIIKGKELLYVLQGKNDATPRYYKVKGTRLLELDADKKEVTTYYLEKVE
jgi:hypothetical protein